MDQSSSSEIVAESCQRALGLALRRESEAAFDLLDATIAAAGNAGESVRHIADAVFLVARWTGDFKRGALTMERMLAGTSDPTTRGWINVRMSVLARPEDSSNITSAALGDFTVAGDDAGQAMSMLGMAFPQRDLLPSVAFRLGLVEAARAVGERLGDPIIGVRATGIRAALLTYQGDDVGADAAYRKVWESFHVGSPLLSSEVANASLNHALTLLSWGRLDDLEEVLNRSRHIVTGPRTSDWLSLVKASALLLVGQHRAAKQVVESMTKASEEIVAFGEVISVSATIELAASTPNVDLAAATEFLEARSMQLGALARTAQATLRAVRGEPRPHRDLAPTLEHLATSKPRFGWDGLAVKLAELAPGEAGDVLADMWDFWPAGRRPAVQRLFTEALLGMRDPYPTFVEVAHRFEANGEFPAAANAMAQASKVAPSGSESLDAHRRAVELYRRTDAERSLAMLLRDRRLRREPGTQTIPESQRYAVNSGLTPREREVTELAAKGLTGREIAAQLGISEGTVRNHLQHARDKLGGLSKRDFTRFT